MPQRQQDRAEKDADEAEDQYAAQYAQADQQNGDAGATGDQDGFMGLTKLSMLLMMNRP